MGFGNCLYDVRIDSFSIESGAANSMMIPPEASPLALESSPSFGELNSEIASTITPLTTTLCANEQELWQQVVLLWMEWHTAQERLTAAMFRSRHDTAQQAELMQQMDQLDQLRWRAVELSQDMLDHA